MLPGEDVRLGVEAFGATVAGLAAKLIQEVDKVHFGDRALRNRAADALAILCRHHDKAFELACQNARNYADLMKDMADASPYWPNGIDVIRKVTNRKEARSLLEEIRTSYMGFAQIEATDALASFDTTAGIERSLFDVKNWGAADEFESWKTTLTEEENRCLAVALATVGGR